MPIPIQSPEMANQLRNVSQLQGGVRLSLDEIVVPVIARVHEEDDELVWDGVATGKVWGGGSTATPPAGERASIRVLNPAGSGAILHLTHCQLRGPTIPSPAIARFVASGSTAGSAIGTVQTRDLRRGISFSAASPIGQILEDFGPAVLPNPEWQDVIAATGFPTQVPLDVYLPPSSSLVVQQSIADEPMEAFFQWTERPLRQAEQRVS